MGHEWGTSGPAPNLAVADMYTSSALESKISKLHAATEEILHHTQIFLLAWINTMRKDVMSDSKFMANVANFLAKVSSMLAILPQKYIPDCMTSMSRNVSDTEGPAKRHKLTDNAVTKAIYKAGKATVKKTADIANNNLKKKDNSDVKVAVKP